MTASHGTVVEIRARETSSPPPFTSGKGPAKRRNDLVEKIVLKDGPECTVSVWRKHFARTTGKAGHGGGGSSANIAGGDDCAAAGRCWYW